MSYTYLLEQGEESSAESFSDIAPSALSSLMATASTCCSNDNERASCHDFRSGMTYGHSTVDLGEAWSMSLPADSPAKTPQQPEKARASKAKGQASGEKWLELSERYDLDSRSWKIRRSCGEEVLPWSSVTLPQWGLMFDGVLYQQQIVTLPIFESGCGYWATPKASDGERGGRGELLHQVKCGKKRGPMWPTPTARDWKSGKASPATMARNSRPLSEQVGGSLNPTWVEWLMGWPLGWTDLEPLETAKFQLWLQQHGVYCCEDNVSDYQKEDIPDHDPYGCSSASRWLQCPGSIQACEGLVSHSSSYANEGTAAHAVCAEVLTGQAMPEHVKLCNRCSSRFEGGACEACGGREYRLDGDMPTHCQRYVDYVLALCDANYVLHRAIENRMQSGRFPEHGGTVDCYLIYQDERKRTWLHVIDFKYGQGVEVGIEGNTQLLCYLNLCREKHPNVRYFRATIVQPRVGDGLPKTTEVALEDLEKLDLEIVDAMLSDHLTAGPHCRWCAAAVRCPKVMDRAKELAQLEFDELEDKEEEHRRLTDFMAIAPALRHLLAEVPQRMLREMKLGHKFDGWKAVTSVGHRTWNGDEGEVVGALLERGVPEEDLYSRKLLTPPQVEKLGYKKAIEGLTFRPLRGFSIAPESDKRPAADVAMAEFDELPELED